ncbi:M48 family metalloprotease [Pseudomonas sp. NW5]|uniref:M48 family metalloprotease n=1 Tax=Pseudomonas sp. NW5 TaxID=2934934 RepID=UPI002020D3DA|nr:M48 family metalloprotease [Pseudomonas sp. NW5]MCL7461591.1 M48 family metalloprotease [Pseudomonas sp. NW5]
MPDLRPALLALACLLATPLPASPLPSLGDASSAIVSPEQEHQLGRAWLSMLRGQVRTLDDPLLSDYVERSVYRLAETSQLEDRRLVFVLLDSPQLNAFAVPGGVVGVNGGLFLHAETEGEYASVMAHELAHLSQRHFARGLEEQRRLQVPLMAAMLAGVVAAAAGAGDAGIAAIASTQAAAIQAQRSFSRQNEQEADRIGLLNLQRAGFDPRSMPDMFERLVRQYRYSRVPPEFLLTHPLSESRVADTRNRAEQLPASGRQDSLEYQRMRARLQLHYETTPGLALRRFRARLDENAQDAAARYGLALAHSRAGQSAEARRELQTLLSESPEEPLYHLALIELDIAGNRLTDAAQRLNRLLARQPSSYPLRRQQAQLQLKQGQVREAERTLDTLLADRPGDSALWYLQAETRGLSGNIIGVHQARAEYFALVGDYPQALEQLDFARRRAASNFPLAARIDARYDALQAEQRAVEGLLR